MNARRNQWECACIPWLFPREINSVPLVRMIVRIRIRIRVDLRREKCVFICFNALRPIDFISNFNLISNDNFTYAYRKDRYDVT